MVSKHGTLGGGCQVANVNRASHATGANLVLATRSVGSEYSDVANTLPTEIAFALITETAVMLGRTPESIQDTLGTFAERDIAEVLEAMQDLGTSDTDTLAAYLTSVSVLDMGLDDFLEVG